MGSGCFRANAGTDPSIRSTGERCRSPQGGEDFAGVPGEFKKELQIVIQLAGRSSLPDEKLDEVLAILSKISPHASSSWLKDWCVKASAKARGGLLVLMQRTIGKALESNLLVAEEMLNAHNSEAAEIFEFGRLADMCRDALSIDQELRSGVHAAVLVLSNASSSGQVAAHDSHGMHGTVSYVVPVLDRLVLFFRASLLANITSSARNRQQWRELEVYIGLPHLEGHMSLLSCGAKAVLLNLILVPEGIPPTIVVVNRENALMDAGNQIPDDRACIVSPYFESTTGTKTVQGRHVEGGEGHGPRKEFFIATSSNALRRWGSCIPSSTRASPSSPVRVSFQGNRITVDRNVEGDEAHCISDRLMLRTLAKACVGDRLQLEFSNGVKAERLITATHGDSGVSVASHFDSSVCNGLVSVRQCNLQKALIPLFEFHRGTGQQWFSAYASELDHPEHGKDLQSRFFTFGKLLLLALANRCKIAFALPVIFFRLLLNTSMPTCLDDLKGFDDELHSSLKKCLKMNMTQFNSLKEVEDLPAEMTREEYVSLKVTETFTPQAMDEIRKGFWGTRRQPIQFKNVSASDLRQMVCPVDNLNEDIHVRQIFKIVIEEEMAECKVFVDAFWNVVDNLSLEEKKLFLRFVTGLEAPPEPGTERLIIELPFSAFSKPEYIAMLDMLPQAHTCTNTLELPNYYEALLESGKVVDDTEDNGGIFEQELRKILKDKLLLAIRETGGYELDAMDPVLSGESPRLSQSIAGSTLNSFEDNREEKIEPVSLMNGLPRGTEIGPGSGARVDGILQERRTPDPQDKKTPDLYGSRSEGRQCSDEQGFRSVESCSPKPPSSESLQSLRGDPEEINPEDFDPVPHVAEEPFKLPPPTQQNHLQQRRQEPFTAEAHRPARSVSHNLAPLQALRSDTHTLAPVRVEPHGLPPIVRTESHNIGRTESHKSIFALEPLRTPVRPPMPFMGEFGSPAKTPSADVMGDGLIDQGFTALLQSRYSHDTHQHPQGKIMGSEIDHLIEELELDMRK